MVEDMTKLSSPSFCQIYSPIDVVPLIAVRSEQRSQVCIYEFENVF